MDNGVVVGAGPIHAPEPKTKVQPPAPSNIINYQFKEVFYGMD